MGHGEPKREPTAAHVSEHLRTPTRREARNFVISDNIRRFAACSPAILYLFGQLSAAAL